MKIKISIALLISSIQVFSESELKKLQDLWNETKSCSVIIEECHCATAPGSSGVQAFVASAFISLFYENNPKKALSKIKIAEENFQEASKILSEEERGIKKQELQALVNFFDSKYNTIKEKIEENSTPNEVKMWEDGNHPEQLKSIESLSEKLSEHILFDSPFARSIKNFDGL